MKVDSARAGDRAALEELLSESADNVYKVCFRVLGNRHDALDASQNALISIAKGITKFDGKSAFSTWVYRIATNAALDELRRRKRRPTPGQTDDFAIAALPGPESAIMDSAGASELLAGLSEEFRTILVLREVCDLDYADIAEHLGVPIGTVRSRISRARQALIQAVGNQNDAAGRLTE